MNKNCYLIYCPFSLCPELLFYWVDRKKEEGRYNCRNSGMPKGAVWDQFEDSGSVNNKNNIKEYQLPLNFVTANCFLTSLLLVTA